jgi:hypothetical protein
MADKVYVGDVGTVVDVDCGESLVAATGQVLKVRKPNGTEVSWTASISTNSLRHTTIAGDFDLVGTYFIQPYLTITGWTGHGKTVSFEVYSRFR